MHDPDDVCLVTEDPPLRLQRRLGIAPREGLGLGRRAVFWALLGWLPTATWAWWVGRAWSPGGADESLLQHYAVHMRLLVGVPLLILAEGPARALMEQLFPQFLHAGLIRRRDDARFHAILADAVRLRDARWPWLAIIVMAISATFFPHVSHGVHEFSWAADGRPDSLGFGARWHVLVGRPIFLVFAIGWLWRLILLGIVLGRIARLDLALVPTHADRAGGLGFVQRFMTAFSLVVFVPSLVIGAGWAHEVRLHGLDVHELYPMMLATLAAVAAFFLSPLLVFIGPLERARRHAMLEYGALVARHGAAVRRKWIEGDPSVAEPLLEASEIGPVVDTNAIYEAVQRTRPVPIGLLALAAILLPAMLPYLAVLALQIPVAELAQELLGQLL